MAPHSASSRTGDQFANGTGCRFCRNGCPFGSALEGVPVRLRYGLPIPAAGEWRARSAQKRWGRTDAGAPFCAAAVPLILQFTTTVRVMMRRA
jgi:hypothetical protein